MIKIPTFHIPVPVPKILRAEQRKALIGFVTIVAIIVALFLVIMPGGNSNSISHGGVYEELAKEHPKGEEYLGLVNDAIGELEVNDNNIVRARSYLDIGFYKNELGDVDGAIEAYKKGLEEFPTHEVILSNLAHIYENKKEYKNAEKYYQQLVSVNPKNIRGIIDFASLYRFYFDGEKNDEIINLVEIEGLANNPNDPNLLSFLSMYYRYTRKDLDMAEVYYRKILELDPTNTSIEAELRNLLRSQGREL